jgi:hypothetical protein
VSNRQRLDRAAKELGDLLATLERGPDKPQLDLSPYRTGENRIERFSRDILQIEYHLGWSKEAYREYESGSRTRIACASAHGGAKTFTAMLLAIYCCWVQGKTVIYCSASSRQNRFQGGGQLKRLLDRSPLEGEVFVYGASPAVGDGMIVFTPPNDPSALQGYHSPNGVCCLIDEAQSDDGQVLEAAEVITIDDQSAIVMFGNPVRFGGSFHSVFQLPDEPPKAPCAWWRRQVSAFEIVRDPAHPYILGLITEKKIKELRQSHGEDSQWFQSRVYARFPRNASDALYPEHAILAALKRGEDGDYVLRGRLGIGIDIAASTGGDESCIAISRNGVLLDLRTWREEDTMISVQIIDEILKTYGVRKVTPISAKSNAVLRTSLGYALMTQGGCGDPLALGHMNANIIIDAIGVSKGVLDRLREMGYEVIGFTASKRCDREGDRDRFSNQRSQIADRFRTMLLRNQIAFTPGIDGLALLVEELRAYSGFTNQQGKLAMVSKDDLRLVIGRSPDRLDGCLMACAGSPNISFNGQRTGPIPL